MNRDEFVFDNTTNPGTLTLTYPAATLDRNQATLRVKQFATPGNDGFETISSWQYIDASTVQVTRPAKYDAGAIYEFIYPAKDPTVMGIGFAATRDIVSFHNQKDGAGNDNPLNGLRQAPCDVVNCAKDRNFDIAIMEGISQSGRFVRDFLWQGFNTGVDGRKVFEGMMPLIGGSRKTWTNMRFAQPGRFSRQHEEHFQAGDQFPFTYATITDPLTGKTDGLLARCTANNTCPKVFQIDGGGEFRQARSSLIVSDGVGREVALPDNVRAYHLVGTPHAYQATAPGTRPVSCKYNYVAKITAAANSLKDARLMLAEDVTWWTQRAQAVTVLP